MTKEKFGETGFVYTLENKNGLKLKLADVGASITGIFFKNKKGDSIEVAFGSDDVSFYSAKAKNGHMGATVGRVAGKTLNSSFKIGDKEYKLNPNKAPHHTHGGVDGLSYVFFTSKQIADNKIEFHYLSKDGEEGYPGTLTIAVTYSLTPKNELVINYKATTDAPTILNPTSHSYFNLHGTNEFSTNSHIMTIYADSFTPTDKGLIPTGEIVAVGGTPLDFRVPTAIGDRIDQDFEPLVFAGGYDHNWVLNKPEPKALTLAAEVYEPRTGILMKILTDQPGMQFYSGNFMTGDLEGKRGNKNNYRSGIALETQNFPDAINQENFPSPILRPGEVYTQTCVYAFEVRK